MRFELRMPRSVSRFVGRATPLSSFGVLAESVPPRPVHDGADVALLVEIDLQQLDVDDDLGLCLVVGLDDLLGDAHLVGGIADGDGVERLEREDVARLDHRPHDVGDLLGVAVREIERADDEVFVIASCLRVVGDDDDGLLVERFVEMIRGLHEAFERLLCCDVLQLDGDAVILHGLIEKDVDAERVAEGFVDLLDRSLLRERERDGLIGTGVELRRRRLRGVGFRAALEVVDGGRLAGLRRFLEGVDGLAVFDGGELVRGIEPHDQLELRGGELHEAYLIGAA